jgi:hypothetical protein
MSQLVKVQVQAGQAVDFPGVCVHCSAPAGERMRLRKRIGRVTRLVDVPLCSDCAGELHRLSGEEERWLKLSWLLSGLVWLVLLAVGLLLLPAGVPFLARFLLALVIALAAAAFTFKYVRQTSLRHARPEKQAILAAARITNFSWRATTFEFANEAFAERFAAINQPQLMEPGL